MTRKLIVLVALLSAMPWTFASAQKLYKWIDGAGNVSYHDRPPPEGSDVRVEEKRVGTSFGDPDDPSDAVTKFPVVLYSVPKCAQCDLARIYMQKHKVPFSERNVEKDGKLQQELKEKAGSITVPTILVGKKVLNGYLESLLEGELKQAGYAVGSAPVSGESGRDGETEFEAPTE